MTTTFSPKPFERKVKNNLTRVLKIVWDMCGVSENERLQNSIGGYVLFRYKAENGYLSWAMLHKLLEACGLHLGLVSEDDKLYPIAKDSQANSHIVNKYIADHESTINELSLKSGVQKKHLYRLLNAPNYTTMFALTKAYGGKLVILLSSEIALEIKASDIEAMPSYEESVSRKAG